MDSRLRNLFFYLVLIFLGHSYASGQDLAFEFKHLKTRLSPSTIIDWSNYDTHRDIGNNYTGFFASDTSNRVWFFTETGVWFFSLTDREWEYYGQVGGISEEYETYYDQLKNEFIFWEREGSQVLKWQPGDEKVSIVSNKTKFKLLEGNSGFVHHASGNIYSFGGRGFGTDHSTMYAFYHNRLAWEIVSLADKSEYPSPRNSAQIAYLPERSEVHVYGGIQLMDGRIDLSRRQAFINDYWIYDLKQSKWREVAIYNVESKISTEIPHNTLKNFFHHRTVPGATDPVHSLIWYHSRNNTSPNNSLMVYDLLNEYGAILPVSLLDNFNMPTVRYLTIDNTTNELLLFWTPYTTIFNNSYVRVTAYRLPEPESVRNFLSQIKTNAVLINDRSINANSGIFWFTGLLLLSSTLILVYRKKQKNKNTILNPDGALKSVHTYDGDTIEYVIDLKEQPGILLNSRPLLHEFSPNELHILIWLSWKTYKGEPFQITDTIEELFFAEFPNLDYSRKHRNITIRRINEQLQRLFKEYVDRETWIIDRPVVGDKRKREYGLNLDGIKVSVRYSSAHEESILPGISYRWVDNIRRDLRS
jgi:hypothetical protein